MTKTCELHETRYCERCQRDVETVLEILSQGNHYAKLNCAECGKYLAFAKKPENKGKRGKNKYSPKDLGVDCCQMCLRHGSRLGRRGALEVHHVVEINAGGEDLPSNLWVVCTACHKLIHHQRVYLNSHLKGMYSINELRGDMEKYAVPKESRAILERIFNNHEVR